MSITTAEPELVVATAEGSVRGRVTDGVRTWRGIPYAAAPVGELRLRHPQPARHWPGILDAGEFGPVPPQRRTGAMIGAGHGTPMSEDCLTINVSAPLSAAPQPRPVLVFFHGGAFSAGSAAVPAYAGTQLVRRGGVVYVSLNYRLGALGFLDFRRYSTPGRPFEANCGLADQVAALRWVRRNIAAFGGDPENVTIFGESAGGTSVTTLMCVPSAAGLFAKAFAQSPAPASAYGPELPAQWAADFLSLLDVPEDGAAQALATLPPEALVRADTRLAHDVGPARDPGTRSLAPVVDGEFLPEHPLDAFRAGRAQRVPLVIGTMAREGAFFDRLQDILPTTPDRLETMFTRTEPERRDQVLRGYPGFPGRKAAVEAGADAVFWWPSIQVAEAHARHAPTWSYRFDYAPRLPRVLCLGATHGVDVPAVFGEYGSGPGRFLTLLGGRRTALAVSQRFQGSLLRLARTGHPGPIWPPYEPIQRITKIFDERDHIVLDPRRHRRLAWNGYRGYR